MLCIPEVVYGTMAASAFSSFPMFDYIKKGFLVLAISVYEIPDGGALLYYLVNPGL